MGEHTDFTPFPLANESSLHGHPHPTEYYLRTVKHPLSLYSSKKTRSTDAKIWVGQKSALWFYWDACVWMGRASSQ